MVQPVRTDTPATESEVALSGRTALVTGSSRGIGRAIAISLAEVGADVVVNYRSGQEAAEETVSRIGEAGQEAIAVQADVSAEEDLVALVEATESELGTIDVLVNNAGIARHVPTDDLTREKWDVHMATNLTAAFLLTQAVVPAMGEQGWGRIINVSSVAAQNGGIIGPHYAASKAGLLGLTRSYARQLASEGVTVNAIAPGLIATDKVTESPVTPEAVPVGRFGTPTEVARVVRSIVCNGFLTGQVINIDGGIYFG